MCFVVIGYGVLVGVVKELEIKFIEMVCVFLSGFELEVYMYGLYLEVNVEYVMFFFEDWFDVCFRVLWEYMMFVVVKIFIFMLVKVV